MLKAYRFTLDDARMRHGRRDRLGRSFHHEPGKYSIRTSGSPGTLTSQTCRARTVNSPINCPF
jgi:hypothetical protein